LSHLEPLQTTAGGTQDIVSAGYSRLVKVDWVDTPTNQVVAPDLAESWDVSKDGLTMTFKLRKGARFQKIDPVNGREVTSEDIKYSLERAAYDPSSLFQATYRNVERFEAPDKYTFVIKMKSFDAIFLRLLSGAHGWIVPKEVVEKYGNLKTVLIGSGPFIFDKWAKDVVIVLKRNPDYYIKGLPYVDEFHYLIVRDEQTRLTAFRTGRTSYLSLDGSSFKEVMKTNPGLVWTKILVGDAIGLGMKYTNPLFGDIRLRKALVLAINREELLKIVHEGDGSLKSPIPAQYAGWDLSQEEQKRFWPHDPPQAKKLLEEAGFKKGLTLELLYTGGRIEEQQTVERLAEQYRAIGITIKLDAQERTIFRRRQDSGDYKDLVLGAENQPMPEAWLIQNYRCGGNKNMMQLCDPKLDKMIDDMASTVNEEERRKKAVDIQRFIMENFYYKITFANRNQYHLWHPWVKGFKLMLGGSILPFEPKLIWLAK